MDDRTFVTLPDMFKGFIVQEPKVNKHYEAVKPVSERWLAKYMLTVLLSAFGAPAMRLLTDDEEDGQRL
ncbi:uncharacterized protein PgNI_02932 [Pyricularia grisea]|uniref:Uncharacterized protein n=1 Tax=Pyricularia grisea TaxID=148305 RepID=A0A6P8BCX5_PYRGI|nr:uncharacterized protein PgNI_02932 [Pyricularia grisea]TLD13609.1 hypothetical protein PgNI_02932 [Pyricularia grisea]